MAKKTAIELGLKPEVIEGQPETMDGVPEEYSPAPPPPYPGRYRFQFPPDLSALWDKFETEIGPEGAKKKVERVSLVFDRDDPLTIVGSPAGTYDGQPFITRINNAERNRAKKGEPQLMVSDMLYLLRAFGHAVPPKTNIEFVSAVTPLSGRMFDADLEWTANCNKERQVYVEVADEAGNITLQPGVNPETQQPVNGCGARFYMNDWKRGADGRYLARHTCSCGAALRPFGQLRNFKGV